jgi:hypothetical protein
MGVVEEEINFHEKTQSEKSVSCKGRKIALDLFATRNLPVK